MQFPIRWKRLFAPSMFALSMLSAQSGAAEGPLSISVYNAPAESFHVNAVLVTGRSEAVLIDTGFTRADAMRIAAMVLDSGKRLTTIYISQADPDFYFGAELLRRQFPQARLVATAQTVKKIEETLPTKLKVWGPRLAANAPAAVPLPDVLAANTLDVEGHALEIRGLDDDLPHRSYLWIPSIRAIAGGVNVFGGLHAWTADTPSAQARAAWGHKLDAMATLRPRLVVPGHEKPGTARDATQIDFTRGYLRRFEQELPAAADGAALIAAMKSAYPEAQLGIALDIGAKVAKGEMKW